MAWYCYIALLVERSITHVGGEIALVMFFYAFMAMLGAAVGGFLSMLIYCVPRELRLHSPMSHCANCGVTRHWYDKIPVVSYIILGGKCRACHAQIPIRYLIVEIANAILWLISACLLASKSIALALTAAMVCSVLICVFVIDLEHKLIFDRFVAALLVLAFTEVAFDDRLTLADSIIGFLLASALFATIYFASAWILKRDGLGFGDVKLAAAAGALLGYQRIFLAILIASCTASVVMMSLTLTRDKEQSREYPFAPFLAVGILVSLFFGHEIVDWYLGIFNF